MNQVEYYGYISFIIQLFFLMIKIVFCFVLFLQWFCFFTNCESSYIFNIFLHIQINKMIYQFFLLFSWRLPSWSPLSFCSLSGPQPVGLCAADFLNFLSSSPWEFLCPLFLLDPLFFVSCIFVFLGLTNSFLLEYTYTLQDLRKNL